MNQGLQGYFGDHRRLPGIDIPRPARFQCRIRHLRLADRRGRAGRRHPPPPPDGPWFSREHHRQFPPGDRQHLHRRQGDLEPPPSEHVQQQEPHRTRGNPRPRRWRPHRLPAFSARLTRGRNGVTIATAGVAKPKCCYMRSIMACPSGPPARLRGLSAACGKSRGDRGSRPRGSRRGRSARPSRGR